MKKRGAMEISFGMIFSIILIIVFVAFAFFGIKKLIGTQETALIEQFKYNLQEDINEMWSSPQGSKVYEYNLPKKIEQVCFVIPDSEYETNNLVFLPEEKYYGKELVHVDFDKTLGSKKEKCFLNSGKIAFKLKKDFGESLVTIEDAK